MSTAIRGGGPSCEIRSHNFNMPRSSGTVTVSASIQAAVDELGSSQPSRNRRALPAADPGFRGLTEPRITWFAVLFGMRNLG